MDGIFQWGGGRLVALAMDISTSNASTRHHRGVTVRPMIAPVIRVVVSAGADSALRAAAEFSDGNNECLIQHATFIEITDQCGQSTIKHRT